MAYQPTTNFGWAMPRGGDQAQISVINQQFTAKADEIVYQTRRMIAPGYIDDGTKTYHEGDIVEYENVDYVCTGTTSGAWDSSKWDATDMATQIQEAKESGGTNVVANPSEPATADLQKLQVENTVYGIPDQTVTKTATGNPIEFSDGANAPLVKCVTQITGYQSGSGTPSPDNIRPIVAYTENTISVGDIAKSSDYTYIDNVYIDANGQPQGNLLYKYTPDYIRVNPNTTYIFSITKNDSELVGVTLPMHDDSKEFISRLIVINPTTTTGEMSAIFTTLEDCRYIRFSVPKTATNITITGVSSTHATTFPSAIYRGSEDVVNGEVTSEMPVIDLGSLNYSASADGYFYSTDFLSDSKAYGAYDVCNALCSIGEKSSQANVSAKSADGIFAISTGKQLMFYISSYAGKTGAEIKTLLTGQTLAYELATPTTTPVTPTNLPIKSLSGYNHIESTTGDMEVEYITQTYQPLVDLIDDAAEQREAYSTDEQEIGTWIDGSKLYQKTYTFSGTGAANPFSTTIDMTSKTITNVIPHYAKYTYGGGTVGYCVGSRLTANNSNVLTIQYNDEAPPTLDVIANLGGSTETYEVCFTLQYIKTSSNNRSLSKGATDSLKAEISEEKKEIEEMPETEEKTVKKAQSEGEESVDKVDKVDEPTETIEEKEENAGESNSENER